MMPRTRSSNLTTGLMIAGVTMIALALAGQEQSDIGGEALLQTWFWSGVLCVVIAVVLRKRDSSRTAAVRVHLKLLHNHEQEHLKAVRDYEERRAAIMRRYESTRMCLRCGVFYIDGVGEVPAPGQLD
jgi:hypothetical protein